jgi:hypothetical protein
MIDHRQHQQQLADLERQQPVEANGVLIQSGRK